MPLTQRSVPDIISERSPTWREVPERSKDVLRNRMVQMYWLGVSREVALLIRTLSSWQEKRYANIDDEDEILRSEDMKGFNAFVERAVGRGRCKRVQADIRKSLYNMKKNARVLSKEQRRAQMLLQGAGFLDISKVMEHRKPIGKGLWSRPRAAQLSLNGYDQTSHIPRFRPLSCAHCSLVIRGTHFQCLKDSCQSKQNLPLDKPHVYCETCMRAGKDIKGHLRKLEKRCILREVISPKRIEQICTCENNQHSGSNEDEAKNENENENESESAVDGGDLYFAVSGDRQHLGDCPVLQLKREYEHARYNELRRNKEFTASDKGRRAKKLTVRRRKSPKDHQVGKSKNGTVYIRNKAVSRAVRSIPPPIEFGNIHMMLMVGTIIIEIGYPESKAGALISIREPPQVTIETAEREREPMMCISPSRRIFQKFDLLEKRRIRAFMKQVVGGIFTGLSEDQKWCEGELDIINSLVDASRKCARDPFKLQSFQAERLSAAADRIVNKLRVLIGDWVTRYFDVLAEQLFTVEIKYSKIGNHCQRFCANILDFRAFGSFLATTPACRTHVPKNPLYLVSFVCSPGSYDTPRPIRPKTKYLPPNGLTEEYILRFRQYGHHEESDIADKLTEYWRDWGNFGDPLYRHQSLFPWDCTEAYRRDDAGGEGKCNNCSIAKHVWSFPFDAWSMIQLHIQKDRHLYPPTTCGERKLTSSEWVRNRLAILSALGALNTIAVAMARTTSFRATCRWNHERKALTPDIASRLDRFKLSGIHRAQPQSHFFEQKKYHDCTLAKWALMSREDQIKEYEMIRDRRADVLEEIPPNPSPRRPHTRLSRSRDRWNSNDTNGDIGFRSADGQRHGPQHQHEENYDSNTDEPTDADEDEYEEYMEEEVEETKLEACEGLLPVSIGADPLNTGCANSYHNHDDNADAADSSLLLSGVGPESDGRKYHCDHDQGAGSCDYDEDNGWIDGLPNHTFEECRRNAGDDNSRAEYRGHLSDRHDDLHQRDEGRLPWWHGSSEDADETPTLELPRSIVDNVDQGAMRRALERISREIASPLINPDDIDLNNPRQYLSLYRTPSIFALSPSILDDWTPSPDSSSNVDDNWGISSGGFWSTSRGDNSRDWGNRDGENDCAVM